MPDLDGFAATAAIRAAEQAGDDGDHIPIVALTASALQRDRDACLQAGMDDYLSKPVKLDDLQAALERWLPAADPSQG
jgi:CheY-like chemotaxis protein